MSRLFYHVMQDNAGNLLFDVTGTMRLAGSGTLATIHGDEALTVILPNPMTNHPSFGSFKCYLGAGSFDFYMAKAGYTFETLTGVQGLGSMAVQNANAVAITGGTATLATASVAGELYSLRLGVNAAPASDSQVQVQHAKSGGAHGIKVQPNDADTGAGTEVLFLNLAAGVVGYIGTSATTTSYVTSSDARLKHAIETLTGALDLLRALRPVAFRWNADDSPGVGLLAQEVAAQVPGVVSGAPDAVDAEGRMIPQGIDYSKLVPYLVGAVQTLAERMDVLEDARGV